jgi:hypothetical protein
VLRSFSVNSVWQPALSHFRTLIISRIHMPAVTKINS